MLCVLPPHPDRAEDNGKKAHGAEQEAESHFERLEVVADPSDGQNGSGNEQPQPHCVVALVALDGSFDSEATDCESAVRTFIRLIREFFAALGAGG